MTERTVTIEQQTVEEFRPYLFAIANRMLGSASEAEDVVQDAYLRLLDANPDKLFYLQRRLGPPGSEPYAWPPKQARHDTS